MVRHIVSWRFSEDFPQGERAAALLRIKNELCALPDIIPGIVSLSVHTELLGGSDADAALDSLFTDAAALAAYQVHPEHKKVSAFVRSVMGERHCLDFEE